MFFYTLLAAAAEAVQPVAEAAETAPATAQQKQSLLESHLNETGNMVRQIHEQGPGFFSNLWEKHSDDIIHLVKVIILALVVIVVAKLVSLAARKIIARLFKKIEGDESLTYATFTIVRTLIWALFRLPTILVLAPCIPLFEKLMVRLVPADPEAEAQTEDMKRLEERFLAYPTLAVEQTRLTINKMASLTQESLTDAITLLTDYSDKGLEKVRNLEGIVDRYEDKIGSYLLRLTGQEMTETQNKAVSQYLRAITDLERISDHALNIAERAEEIHEKKIRFSDKGWREMENLTNAIQRIVSLTFDSFLGDDIETAYQVEPLEQIIDRICRKMREKHASRLQKGKCTIIGGYVFNDLISDFERVSDHCSNIAIVLVELMDNALDVHEMSEAMHQEHVHHFEEYYAGFAADYLTKKDLLPED